jgi:hypothetical protein
MASYPINKGVGRSVEVKGLRAGYVIYAVVGTVFSFFILFFFMLINRVFALVMGTVLLITVWCSSFYLNRKYGQYGLLHRRAKRVLPRRIAVSCPIFKLLHHEKSIR